MVQIKPDYDKKGNPTGETFESYGALCWYSTSGDLYDANYDDLEGELVNHYDYAYLVIQLGNVNLDYV